ncbi:hypothetical protein KBC79_04590 [Candidatus Woesebacteria bacterium]|nr:hypothetical protein [Candidatus Woesebacteria bacterium]
MDTISEVLQPIIGALFSPNSIWSVVLRGVIWVAVAMVIILSSDSHDPEKSLRSLKSNLGFLVIFLVLSGGLVYLLFGYSSTPA